MASKDQRQPSQRFPHLLLIEASAGSGKTHALSRRYVEFLLGDDIPHNQPANLLAITFTNNAAREMKERILGWLKDLALGADAAKMAEIQPLLGISPQEVKARAGAMVDVLIEHYSDFQVQTIDSFTNRLAKAAAGELGFRPDFKTTTSHGELIDYALALLTKEIGPGRDGELTEVMDRFLELLNLGGGSFAWDPQAKMRERFEAFLAIESKETGRFVFSDQSQNIKQCLSQLGRVHDEVAAYAKKNGLVFEGKENLLWALEKEDVKAILGWSSFNGENTPIVKNRQPGKLKPLVEPSKRIWAQTQDIVARLAVAYAIAGNAAYNLPYGRFKKHLETVKRRQGSHHIRDIAKRLSDFLRQEMVPEIYLKLGARLHHYLIDEFQDTDSAQWRSLMPLLAEALAGDGSAFLVGDLKQAIYMFRQADYRIMKELKEEIGAKRPGFWLPASVQDRAEVQNLGLNRRSGQFIVDYVAETFRGVLPDLIGQGRLSPDRTGLTTYRQEPSAENAGQGYVEVRHIQKAAKDSGQSNESQDEVRAAILEIIADVTGRKYGFHDIAILAGTNWELEQAIDWLTQAGIPATSSSGLDIRRRKVTAEIIGLMRWLHSPIDNVAWAGIVGGEVLAKAAQADGFQWSRETATGVLTAAGRRAGLNGYLYGQSRKEASFAPLWDRYLEELYNLAGFSPVYDLMCLAIERFGVFEHFPEENAAVLKLLEVVNRLESEGTGSLADFLEACDRGQEDLFGLELPENMPAVQLLTYFKAKGMGFPVVINLIAEYRKKGAKHYYRKEGEDIILYHLDEDIADRTAGQTPDLRALKDERDGDVEIQTLNSLYVACTRAKNELYNLVILEPPAKKKTPEKSPPPPPLFQALFPPLGRGQKGVGQGLGMLSQPGAIRSSGVGRHSEWLPEPAWSRARFIDTKLGNYLHRVLQGFEFLPPSPGPLIEKSLVEHHRLAPEVDFGGFAEKLGAFLADSRVSPWFSPREGRTVEREVEFIDRQGRLLRMVRLVCDSEEVTVLDFKAGADDPVTKSKHQAQIRDYLHILQEVFPKHRVRGIIAYLDRTVVEVRL
jgi:ATP-dependent exoDNAse (exonuclease V) beta subunit